MNQNEILNSAREIRDKFLLNVIPLITKKAINNEIYSLYSRTLEDIIKNDDRIDFEDYFNDMPDLTLNLKNRQSTNQFLLILYNMLANINNCYLFHLEKHGEDVTSFFSGFSLYEVNHSKEELRHILLSKSENDIDMLELIDINSSEDLSYLHDKKYDDMFILKVFSNSIWSDDYKEFKRLLLILLSAETSLKNSNSYKLILKVIKNSSI